MQFPQILRNLMVDNGYSNYKLAKLLDISQSTVAYWLELITYVQGAIEATGKK